MFENTPLAPTNDRKHTKQTKKLRRGQRFKKAITDAISPIHVTAIIIVELDEIQ